ncbi:hypothetical protein GQ600_21746 [Phytophthora cactorum]|nr:hypothetical protein GQ600_21746 [Phytophthora cactorum]
MDISEELKTALGKWATERCVHSLQESAILKDAGVGRYPRSTRRNRSDFYTTGFLAFINGGRVCIARWQWQHTMIILILSTKNVERKYSEKTRAATKRKKRKGAGGGGREESNDGSYCPLASAFKVGRLDIAKYLYTNDGYKASSLEKVLVGAASSGPLELVMLCYYDGRY